MNVFVRAVRWMRIQPSKNTSSVSLWLPPSPRRGRLDFDNPTDGLNPAELKDTIAEGKRICRYCSLTVRGNETEKIKIYQPITLYRKRTYESSKTVHSSSASAPKALSSLGEVRDAPSITVAVSLPPISTGATTIST